MNIEDFTQRFKQIVNTKKLIAAQIESIRNLSNFDKDGSHSDVIIKAKDKNIEIKKNFNKLLNKKSYDEWILIRNNLSKLLSKKKRLLEHALKTEIDIDKLLDFD